MIGQLPKISVITAVYNGAAYLRPLIDSVLQQSYPHFEHIIIDDGSDDEGATVSVLSSYPHLYWWSRENRGQYFTQNEGLAAASGDIVCVISADDVFRDSNVFGDVVRYWRDHPSCDLVYGKTWRMNHDGDLLPCRIDVTGRSSKWLLRHYLSIQHCSLFVSRDLVVDNEIWFDPSYRYAGDWDWIIRLFNKASRTGYLPEPLSIIRVHGDQTSRTAASTAVNDEHRRICKQYGSHYWLHVVLHHLVNYRAMALIAIAALFQRGPAAVLGLGREWISKRLSKAGAG